MSCPKGQSEDGGRAKRALLHRPHYLSQAAQHGAEAHQTMLGRGPRANIPKFFWRKAGSRGRRSAVVPAGTSWGGKGRPLRAELPPPARSRHVAAAPLGTAGKVQLEPGSRVRGEKVRRPPLPESASASPTPDNGSSMFPLSLPAPRSNRPPPLPPRTPAPARSQMAVRRPTQPPPHSRILRPPRPHPPITRWAGHARSGCGAPSPVPGWGKRMTAEKGGLSPPAGGGCGSAIGEPPGQSARRRANGEPGETR